MPACTSETAQRLLAEFRFLVDLPPYSLDFSIPCVLQAKVQATPHSYLVALRPTIATEWDPLAAVHMSESCRSFHRCLRKIMFELNRWIANSPTHTNQHFSGLKEALTQSSPFGRFRPGKIVNLLGLLDHVCALS